MQVGNGSLTPTLPSVNSDTGTCEVGIEVIEVTDYARISPTEPSRQRSEKIAEAICSWLGTQAPRMVEEISSAAY